MVDVEPEEWLDDRPSPVAKKIFSFVFFDARQKRDTNKFFRRGKFRNWNSNRVRIDFFLNCFIVAVLKKKGYYKN